MCPLCKSKFLLLEWVLSNILLLSYNLIMKQPKWMKSLDKMNQNPAPPILEILFFNINIVFQTFGRLSTWVKRSYVICPPHKGTFLIQKLPAGLMTPATGIHLNSHKWNKNAYFWPPLFTEWVNNAGGEYKRYIVTDSMYIWINMSNTTTF